jgi:predicted nucleotidyltransferase component of viral defense system
MTDMNRHKFLLTQILKDIYADLEIGNYLGFKGGTALMFFYDLPRFSVDLDFNLLDESKSDLVYNKIRSLLTQYGTLHDEAKKHFGLLLVLNYGQGDWKLKVEISNRQFPDRYQVMDLLGIPVRVMVPEDMFSHKLCALLDRTTLLPRDIFDSWFFMQSRTALNRVIIETRMGMPLVEYLDQCISKLESSNDNRMLSGLGELMDSEMKIFVKTKMRKEVISLLRLYKEYPIISD